LKLVFSCVCRFADHATTALVSAKVGASAAFRTTGGPSEVSATQPVPRNLVLNSPPRDHAAALHPFDVPVEARGEGEDVLAADRQACVGQVQQVHVVGPFGEEHIALPLTTHQRPTFSGQGFLESRGAAALEREVHAALIGHHRALMGHDRLAEAHAQQLRILHLPPASPQVRGGFRPDLGHFSVIGVLAAR
jgi:hypothetical protein